jgi:RNA-directed DNA polymerase
LDALWVGIVGKKVNWILDLDIRSFLDHVQHHLLLEKVARRVPERPL